VELVGAHYWGLATGRAFFDQCLGFVGLTNEESLTSLTLQFHHHYREMFDDMSNLYEADIDRHFDI
jgi:hypothetical protein